MFILFFFLIQNSWYILIYPSFIANSHPFFINTIGDNGIALSIAAENAQISEALEVSVEDEEYTKGRPITIPNMIFSITLKI